MRLRRISVGEERMPIRRNGEHLVEAIPAIFQMARMTHQARKADNKRANPTTLRDEAIDDFPGPIEPIPVPARLTSRSPDGDQPGLGR
jgi:hypothetical protein